MKPWRFAALTKAGLLDRLATFLLIQAGPGTLDGDCDYSEPGSCAPGRSGRNR
jgi:hypothetical protein